MKTPSETKILTTSNYTAMLTLDFFNERLRVIDYRGNVLSIVNDIQDLFNEHPLSKMIFHCRPEHWKLLLSFGFELEAIFQGFFNGTDNYAMALYKSVERRTNNNWIKEDQILTSILNTGRNQIAIKDIPEIYQYRKAIVRDAESLAMLYEQVFPIYPTPMNDPNYVKKVMIEGAIFYIVECNKQIVSAASADVNKTYNHAELTDCATAPEHRKYGLMKKLLIMLEDDLKNEQIFCVFSIARSLSFGMNAAFYQLGYEYRGRMANNCYIYHALEDMNVWVKDLSK